MIKTCRLCGSALVGAPSEVARRKFCSRRCAAKNKGVNPVTTRYASVKRNGERRQEHRWVMEQALGRRLAPHEFVHHKNGVKTDNRLENLEVVDPVTHGREHHLRYAVTKTCVVCGASFTPHKTKRKRQQTCGARACVGEAIRRGRGWSSPPFSPHTSPETPHHE